MTAQRQESCRRRPGLALIGLLAGLAALAGLETGLGTGVGKALGSTTERVVVNRYSGLAIEGFDPVAYFADARAVRGLPDYEAAEGGAVWRFRNESNRAAFVAHPDIYGPQFGGYDPIDLARGVTYAGNPLFWVVSGQRLYLFGREESRTAFAADPAHFVKEAGLHWPELQRTLAQ